MREKRKVEAQRKPYRWTDKNVSLVLAQNKHYWRVSDIANQKASNERNLGARE